MGSYLLITPKQNELYHHGIKGQKWGVRRFQNKDGTRTKAGKDRAKYIRDRAKASRGGVVDDTWKTGSSMLVGEVDRKTHEYIRASGGWSKFMKPAEYVKFFVLKDLQGEGTGFGDTPWDSKFTSFDDYDLGRVNPKWGEPGTTQNCAKCTVATELARCGVSVTAGRQTFPSSSDAMSYWFDGATKETKKLDEMEETLAGYGEGASGSISGYYPGGAGGHCMHFSVSGGKVHVQDGQNGKRFGSIREAAEEYGFDMHAFRLDTATPNWDHLAEDSVISSPSEDRKRWYDTETGEMRDEY